jgi:[acyl-carrier-protein] S-malonyltransferase
MKAAFLFPGQGAQTVGMGRALLEAVPAARRLFDQASEALGYDLAVVCLNGPKEKLDSTAVSQPAIFVTSLAALEQLRATEPAAEQDCTAAAGLSLGEYTALTFAGALSFRDGVKLVHLRGTAMQAAADATPGAMVSVVGPDVPTVEQLCEASADAGLIRVANLLCPGNTVVSGALAACEKLEKLAAEQGCRTVRLAVAGAFHTPLMKPADERLAEALASVELRSPRVPVWSNVDARPHTDPTEIRNLLVRQVLQPVRWEETVRQLLSNGVEQFYEIGPGRVLAGLLKRVSRQAACRNVTA